MMICGDRMGPSDLMGCSNPTFCGNFVNCGNFMGCNDPVGYKDLTGRRDCMGRGVGGDPKRRGDLMGCGDQLWATSDHLLRDQCAFGRTQPQTQPSFDSTQFTLRRPQNQREVCRTQHVAASARHTSCFMSRPRHRSFGMQVRRRRRRLRRHEYCMWVLWGTRRRNRNDIYRRGWGGCHLAAWSAGAGSGVPPARPGPACTQPRRKRAATQYCPMLTIFNMRTPCLGRIWVGIGRTCTT